MGVYPPDGILHSMYSIYIAMAAIISHLQILVVDIGATVGYTLYMIAICPQCGGEFEVGHRRLYKYCSRECFHESIRIWREYACLNCGIIFRRTGRWKGKGKYCSIECAHEHNRGENHASWRGGVWSDPYPAKFSKALRLRVRKRDKFQCKICSCLEGDIPHDVHHIDGDKANNIVENLVTLCSPCHLCRVHSPNGEGLEHWARRFSPVYSNAA